MVWHLRHSSIVAYRGGMGIKAGLRLRWSNARVRLAQELEWALIAADVAVQRHGDGMEAAARWALGRTDDHTDIERSP